jgi:hypothetical protein
MSTIANESEEKEHPEARSAPNEGGVYSAIYTEGAESIERPSSALFWSALSAGLSMGFSMVAQALIKSSLPEVEWRPLFVKLGYSVGFLIVVLGRQQLFTEKTLMPVLPWLQHKTGNHFVNLLRVWAVVLMGNILGSFLFAIACYFSPVFESNVQKEFVSLGVMAVEHPFGTTFGRAIFVADCLNGLVNAVFRIRSGLRDYHHHLHSGHRPFQPHHSGFFGSVRGGIEWSRELVRCNSGILCSDAFWKHTRGCIPRRRIESCPGKIR